MSWDAMTGVSWGERCDRPTVFSELSAFTPLMKNPLSGFIWISLCTFTLSLALPALHTQAEMPSQSVVASQVDDTAIDTFVEQLMADKQIPGLSLAVIHDQKLIKAKGYGMLNRERNVKVRPSSIFPIASISKPLTATAILLLVEDGAIDLDATVSTYLTDASSKWNNMTIRQMLNHTAGLSESVYQSNFHQLIHPEQFVSTAGRIPLDFQPGESWMYSNTGYNLAAAIVEKVSQQPFEQFVKERIFEPLEMNATDVLRDSYQSPNIAMGYVVENGKPKPIDIRLSQVRQQMRLFLGSGSITSNVVDLAKWAIAMQKGQLLSAESHAAMTVPGITNSGLTTSYGLGWFINEINSHKTVSHGGNLWGYSTSLSQFPDDQLTIIVLTNKDNEFGDRLALEIASQYSDSLLIDKDRTAITDEQPELTTKLLSYLRGDSKAIQLAPEVQTALDSTLRGEYTANLWREYVQQNTVNTLELIEQSSHANGMKYRYRVVTDEDTQLLTTIVTSEGLIASIGIGPYSY